ncbi:MAG: hypothetical protein D3909_15730 [Candidatus Electrothrix sp. ATG1]|nr:hypothetical protein [Candidatus Electrothrix sp. ATG1]
MKPAPAMNEDLSDDFLDQMRINEDFRDGVDMRKCILRFFPSDLNNFFRHDPQNHVIQAAFRVREKQGQVYAEPLHAHNQSEIFGKEEGKKEKRRK